MDLKGFEPFNIGDSVSFGAEIYRYLKTGNGKVSDYGLRNIRTYFDLSRCVYGTPRPV